jgi:hypothetical protein
VRFKKFAAIRADSQCEEQVSPEASLQNGGGVEEVYLNVDLITRVEKAGFQHTTPFMKFGLVHDVTRFTLANGTDQGVCVLMGLEDVMRYIEDG